MCVREGAGKGDAQIDKPGVALPFRDLRQPTRNITYFPSMAQINAHYKAKMIVT